MPADPSLLAALQAAVEADPDNPTLRVHLASLLLESDDPAGALGHLVLVLGRQPDHVEALALAARAADVTGDRQRAEAWRRLHAALAPRSVASPAAFPDPVVPDAAASGEATRGAVPPSPGDPPPIMASSDDEGDGWDASFRELLEQEGYWERVLLDDVGGLEEVKLQIQSSFLEPLRHPEIRRAYGASLRGGLLLWGPPGCGKTFLARAIAGELGAHFASVGLNDVLDMWMGNSEKQLHALFEGARRSAPFVLFFDELDAVGHKRLDLGRSAARNVVAQLLTELDGAASDNDGLFVLGATNQPWDVEPALRRPGRFDRTILILPPDLSARLAILRYHLKNRPTDIGSLDEVVQLTDGFSGADLRLVCEDATQRALSAAIQAGTVQPITTGQLLDAARSVRPSTRAWFETAGSFARYSNASGEYDDLVAYMRRHHLG